MKILIIGSGLQYKRRISALKSIDSIISLSRSGLSDSEAYKKFINIKLNDIDAAIICNPPSLHHRYAFHLINNKIPTLCEKPLTSKSKDAKDLLDLSKKNRTLLQCGFNHRFHPSVIKAKKLITKNFIGKIINIRATYGMCGRDGYENEWRSKKKYAIGGHFGEQGIHLVDLIRYLANDIDEVCSMNNIGYFKKQNLEDNGSAILKLKNGAIATINSSMIEWKNFFNMSIFGTEGYIFLDGLGGTYGEQKITYGKREFSKPFEDKTIYFRGGDKSWSNEWNHFIKQMKLKHRSDDSGFKSVLIIEKTYESQKKKKFIKV